MPTASDVKSGRRTAEFVGLILGAAATALVVGAGVAHAEDGPASSAASTSSSAASDADGRPNEANDADSKNDDTQSTENGKPRRDDPDSEDDTESSGEVTSKERRAQRVSGFSNRRSDEGRTDATETPPADTSETVESAEPVDVVKPETDDISESNVVVLSRPEVPAPSISAPSISTASTPDEPAASLTVPQMGDPAQAAAQFVRQIVGLSVDVGALSASLIHNVATQFAYAIGPEVAGGVPYHVALGLADIAGSVSRILTDTPLNASGTGPFPVNYGVFDVLAYLNPLTVPAGANDPSITVTPSHPLPVILINGTLETQGFQWSVGAPVLANAGYKVFTFNYGNTTPEPRFPFQGIKDIALSAQELASTIDAVLAETGAEKVILVGHSQGGGILPAYYINVLGGADKISQLIGIAPSNHGTDLNYLAYTTVLPLVGPLLSGLLGAFAPALLQQTVSSPFQQLVYGNGDTRPGVLYTNIITVNDEIVTPFSQQLLSGPNVTNIIVQQGQPGFQGGHLGIVVNPVVWTYVLGALSANPEASPAPVSTFEVVLAA